MERHGTNKYLKAAVDLRASLDLMKCVLYMYNDLSTYLYFS